MVLVNKMRFTVEERIFIIKTYYREGPKAVLDKWYDEFQSNQPSRRHVYKVITKFE